MPNTPVAGQTTTISAEFEGSFPVEEVPTMLVLYRAPSEEEHDGEIAITHERVSSVRYEATVVGIPEPGSWALEAFPDKTGWSTREVPPGYQDILHFEAVARNEATATPGDSLVELIPFGAAAVILLSVAGTVHQVFRRRFSLDELA